MEVGGFYNGGGFLGGDVSYVAGLAFTSRFHFISVFGGKFCLDLGSLYICLTWFSGPEIKVSTFYICFWVGIGLASWLVGLR